MYCRPEKPPTDVPENRNKLVLTNQNIPVSYIKIRNTQ